MDNIVFACIAPHGGELIPLLSGPASAKAQASRAALTELGRRLAVAQPETIVIIEPHGLMVHGAISLLDSTRVHGDVDSATAPDDLAHSFSMTFAVDKELNAAIASAGRASGVPIARARYFVNSVPLAINWTTLIPMWFLGPLFSSPPKLVVAGTWLWPSDAPEADEPGVTRDALIGFGRAVRTAAAETGRRIAFIASTDLAHAHTADGPYGFHPAAAEREALLVEAVRANALDRLLNYTTTWAKDIATEALPPLLALHGLVGGTTLRAEVLSHEVPTYYGMMCAAYNEQ